MFESKRVISWIQETFRIRDFLLIALLIVVYAATRLINLDTFPIFSDEGIYIQWAKIARHDATWRFISLTDGKQPLQTWGTIPFLKLFPDNALLAGRLFAVSTGFVALAGMYSFGLYLWGKRSAYIASLLYIFTPYFLFYDRMALVDSGVNAVFIWILFLSIVLARTLRLDVALILGLLGGFALLTKSSVRMFIGLGALAPILFYDKHVRKFMERATNYYLLYAVVAFLSLLIYNVQRLSPFFHYVAEKNKTFVLTFDEFIANPFAVFANNITSVPTYIFWELGFVAGILGLIGLIMLFRKDFRLALYFLAWIAGPFIVVVFLSEVVFPRYLIFFAGLLTMLAAYFFAHVKKKQIVTVAVILYILSVSYFDYTILFDHKNIPFPPVDRGQYIEGWPAGWGMKDIMDYARTKSSEKPVIILAEGNFGLSGDVLNTHMKRGDTMSVRAFWPLEAKQLLEHQDELDSSYVYVVVSHRLEYPKEWPVTLVKKFDKPGNQSVIYFLELHK